jgi:CheY-like chemotaxis protein
VPQKVELEGSLPRKFILICEDDQDDQEMLTDVFSAIDNSFVLFFVNNGKEIFSALDKLHHDQLPCLIVLDYNMPGMNGAEILGALNQIARFEHIPKVVWSTSGSQEFQNACLSLGAKDYIIKPTSSNDLEKIVRYMLAICEVPVSP